MKTYRENYIRKAEIAQLILLHQLFMQKESRHLIFQGGTAMFRLSSSSASATLICPNMSPFFTFSFEVCAIRLSIVAFCCFPLLTVLTLIL